LWLISRGLNSLDNVLVITRDLKEVIGILEENTSGSLISNSEHTDIPKKEISNLFGLFLEDCALNSATEVKVQVYATNSCFRISLNDDGDGKVSKVGENFSKIKESHLKFEAKSNLRSIADVRSSLIIDIPYAKTA